mmetsp:Transcript_8880/g.15839  ORF Transcript_8880/g.15839 Transcript_8880/m.15839 type:complete len:204 (+) Transcript_8880:1197-1808(+)
MPVVCSFPHLAFCMGEDQTWSAGLPSTSSSFFLVLVAVAGRPVGMVMTTGDRLEGSGTSSADGEGVYWPSAEGAGPCVGERMVEGQGDLLPGEGEGHGLSVVGAALPRREGVSLVRSDGEEQLTTGRDALFLVEGEGPPGLTVPRYEGVCLVGSGIIWGTHSAGEGDVSGDSRRTQVGAGYSKSSGTPRMAGGVVEDPSMLGR